MSVSTNVLFGVIKSHVEELLKMKSSPEMKSKLYVLNGMLIAFEKGLENQDDEPPGIDLNSEDSSSSSSELNEYDKAAAENFINRKKRSNSFVIDSDEDEESSSSDEKIKVSKYDLNQLQSFCNKLDGTLEGFDKAVSSHKNWYNKLFGNVEEIVLNNQGRSGKQNDEAKKMSLRLKECALQGFHNTIEEVRKKRTTCCMCGSTQWCTFTMQIRPNEVHYVGSTCIDLARALSGFYSCFVDREYGNFGEEDQFDDLNIFMGHIIEANGKKGNKKTRLEDDEDDE